MTTPKLDDLPAGLSPDAWNDATQRALAEEAASRLGEGFLARDGFVVHEASGLELAVVPGGSSVMGARAAEQAHFDDAAFLDDPRHRDAIESGELELLRRATLASVPAQRTQLRPFLLGRAPMTRAQAEALGLVNADSRQTRIFGSHADEPLYFVPGELDAAVVPHGLRLPTEEEWEHACRFGGAAPFRWGAELPTEPIDPPHPLGLRSLGWHRERCAGAFRPSYDAEAVPTADHVGRGGAAALYPWQTGCGEWTLLLPYHRVRLTSDFIDGQYAVRWALDLPGVEAKPALPGPLVEEVATTTASRETLALVEALGSGDEARLVEALDGAVRLAGRGLWSAQCVHLVSALVDALARAGDALLPRVARALGAVAAGDPSAFGATGFDPGRAGWRAACATNAARGLRAAVERSVDAIAALLGHPSAVARIHAAFLLPLVAPEYNVALGAISSALAKETDDHARLGEAIAYGLVARRTGHTTAPSFASGEGSLSRAARILATLPLGHAPSDDDVVALVDAARTAAVDAERLPWRDGRLDMLIAFHLDQHDPRPLAAARFLAKLARAAGPEHALVGSYVSGALALGFPGRRLGEASTLTEAERAALEDLSAFDVDAPRVAAAFEALGVPAEATARRTWLGA